VAIDRDYCRILRHFTYKIWRKSVNPLRNYYILDRAKYTKKEGSTKNYKCKIKKKKNATNH